MLAASAGRVRSLVLAAVVAMAIAPIVQVSAAPAALAQTPSGPTATAPALYLAEGNTLPGWKEFITILNPSDSVTATVAVQYACEQPAGTKVSCGIAGDTVTRTIAPLARDTLQVFDPAAG